MKTLHHLLCAIAALPCAYAQDAVSFNNDTYGVDDAEGTPYQTFKSNPDVKPPVLQIHKNETGGLADGLVFVGVNGGPSSGQNWPTIWDFSPARLATLIWTGNYTEPFDFKPQTYKNEPVLTFWSGEILDGHGHGTFHILNQSYSEIASFSPIGYENIGDLHEFTITEDDTALVIIYTPKEADLRSVGGEEDGWIYENVFQEIEIETGRLVFEWNASAHVGLNETVNEINGTGTEDQPFDFFHMNSVEKDGEGNFLVSARLMDAVYKISGSGDGSGDVIWRLGGTQSDFDVEEEAVFAFQHDARWIDEAQTRMTLFDNGPTENVEYSRGLLLDVDQDARTVALVRDFYNDAKTFGQFMGSLQAIDPGNNDTNYFIGYGSEPNFAEFDKDGNLLLDVQFGTSNVVTNYRAYKLAWQGKPSTKPDISFDEDEDKVYVSWNGATDVEWWDVYTANDTDGTWRYAASANRTGFETTIELGEAELDTYLMAKAVNESGDALGWTQATDGNELFDASGDVSEERDSTSNATPSMTAGPTESSPTAAKPPSSTSGVAVRIGQNMVEKLIVVAVAVALI